MHVNKGQQTAARTPKKVFTSFFMIDPFQLLALIPCVAVIVKH